MKRLLTLFIISSILGNEATAQFTTGTVNAANITSNSIPGSINWSNPLSALLNDGNRTTSTALLLGDDTDYLEFTGFNINIPVGMIITGIEVTVVKNGTNGLSYSVTDREVRIIKGGVITGNNLAVGGKWPSSDQTFTYGNSTETWGTTWTPADVNANNFGIAISAHLGGLLLSTARVNAVSVNVSYDNAPLPVTMISFDAKEINGQVNLDWATATETNNYGFTIQRSYDGTHWENVGEVSSHNANSTSVSYYSFIDQSPLNGQGYYRLAQHDINSATTHTAIVTVHNSSSSEISLYPNPAQDVIHVSYAGKDKVQTITLLELTGRALQQYNAPEENQELSFSTADIKAGEYLISLTSATAVVYERIMVTH